VPEAIAGILFAKDDHMSVLVDLDVVVITKLTEGDEGAGFEVVKNVASSGREGQSSRC
jgi:hypothetical protein